MSFFNAAILIGLVAVAIPPIIHLLNRRRYDVIDWGAMQFLQISEITRRRLLIEELLLMLLRMGLIAILVFAVAAPYTDRWIPDINGRPSRDIVLVVDGSASMSFGAPGESAQKKAIDWAERFMQELHAGDTVAVIVARRDPILLVPKLTPDLEGVRKKLHGDLPPLTGGCDWPAAVKAAQRILADGQGGKRDIILLGDSQKFGLVDQTTMKGWKTTAERVQDGPPPSLWVVNVDAGRPEKAPNWSVKELVPTRNLVAVNEKVVFRSALQLNGMDEYKRPHKMKVRVNDEDVLTLDEQHEGRVDGGQVPVEFSYKFAKPGSYLVSLIVEPDPPEKERKAGYKLKDLLPADNRTDFVIEVVEAVPIVLVDGSDPDAKKRPSDFLRDNLSPAKDDTPAFLVHVVSSREFDSRHLKAGLKDVRGRILEAPRVLILANVPSLNSDQKRIVEQFVKDGGGLLVALGDKCEPESWNKLATTTGLLPAQLVHVAGEDKLEGAARPVLGGFVHPALEMFRNLKIGGLDTAWFGRWWRLTPVKSDDTVIISRLTRDEVPFLIEKKYGEGRVIVCATPLDNSWRTNLTDLVSYVPLLQELTYYLGVMRRGEMNVALDRQLLYRIPADASNEGYQLQGPLDPKPKPLTPGAIDVPEVYSARIVQYPHYNVLVHEGLNEPGVWKLITPDKQTVHYVVQGDLREFDLTPMGKEDKEKLREIVPVSFEDKPELLYEKLPEKNDFQEFWWILLLGVVVLLCGEVWFTRKIVRGRA